MTDTPELLAAYKRLALAVLAYYGVGPDYHDEAEYDEMRAAESALRALLAPKDPTAVLIDDLRKVRDEMVGSGGWDNDGLPVINRAIAALEGK